MIARNVSVYDLHLALANINGKMVITFNRGLNRPLKGPSHMARFNWNSIDDFLQSREWEYFDSDRRGNDLYLTDPDRADRCNEAAENGSDGSTHAEIIEDWRAFLSCLKVYDPAFDDPDEEAKNDITQAQYDAILFDINSCEQWHDKNGSLNQQLS